VRPRTQRAELSSPFVTNERSILILEVRNIEDACLPSPVISFHLTKKSDNGKEDNAVVLE